jgi:hypothetical protein
MDRRRRRRYCCRLRVEAAVADGDAVVNPDGELGARAHAQLLEELRAASAHAASLGFPRMARQLDALGGALAGDASGAAAARRAVVERARLCLELWQVLRDW